MMRRVKNLRFTFRRLNFRTLLLVDRHAKNVFRASCIGALAIIAVLVTGLWLLRLPSAFGEAQELETLPRPFPVETLGGESFRTLRDVPARPSVTDPTGSLNLTP
jgi:hypothetical protein